VSEQTSKVLEKAKPPAAGIGRKKGVPNKLTKEVKQMIAEALNRAGGVNYLVKQADKNPKAFMSLVGRIVPLHINADHSGSIMLTRAAAEAEVREIFDPPRLVANG
jgi:NAD(P)-dependent dehydrogenase (short-subunit alcohol dehydrogenase family)